MSTLRLSDLGWVAGVLDVRGYLSERASPSTDNRLPTVAVTITANDDGSPHLVIQRLCKLTNVEPIAVGKGSNRTACATHCPKPHIHVRLRYHRWQVGGLKAIVVLRAVSPYMINQQKEAKRLARMTAQYKPASVTEMGRLGWPT